MIELDDTNAEYVRCTCLDRARIALEQTGQHHCALQMKNLQDEFDWFAVRLGVDPSDPVGVLQEIYEYMREYFRPGGELHAPKRPHTAS